MVIVCKGWWSVTYKVYKLTFGWLVGRSYSWSNLVGLFNTIQIFQLINDNNHLNSIKAGGGVHNGVVANVLDWDFIVNEFEI